MGQEVFKAAIAAYNDTIHDVETMAQIIERAVKTTGKDFSAKKMINSFDIILQYSMLQIAVADGEISDSEIMFIKDITKHADICVYLSNVAKAGLTWNDFLGAGVGSVKKLLESIKGLMVDIADDFCQSFAAFDASNSYNYVADLENNVVKVIFATCKADGFVTASETKTPCLIFAAINQIKSYKDTI